MIAKTQLRWKINYENYDKLRKTTENYEINYSQNNNVYIRRLFGENVRKMFIFFKKRGESLYFIFLFEKR